MVFGKRIFYHLPIVTVKEKKGNKKIKIAGIIIIWILKHTHECMRGFALFCFRKMF